jgi:hypothetical protein
MFKEDGLVPGIARELLRRGSTADGEDFHLEVTMVEIYNENVLDLLTTEDRKFLKVCDSAHGPPYVAGAVSVDIRTGEELVGVINVGLRSRALRATIENAVSCRAHVICILTLQRKSGARAIVTLADLAGNERHLNMGAMGDRLLESNTINKSTDALGELLSIVTSADFRSAPHAESNAARFRASSLTHLLKPALGGGSKAWWIGTISPSAVDHTDTQRTLRLMQRIRRVPCLVEPNLNANENMQKALTTKSEKLMKAIDDIAKSGDDDAQDQVKVIQTRIEGYKRRLDDLRAPWGKRCLRARPGLSKLVKDIITAPGKSFYLANIDADSQMSGRVQHMLMEKVVLGADADVDIMIPGVLVEGKHCTISVSGTSLKLLSLGSALCIVNGKKIFPGEEMPLHIGDRILLGSCLLYQVCSGSSNALSTWKDCLREIFGAQVRSLTSNFKMLQQQLSKLKDGRAAQEKVSLDYFEDEVLVAAYSVAEACAISKVLHKHEVFEPIVMPGEHNQRDITIGIKVTITEGEKRSSTWTRDKFYMRLYMMRQLHSTFMSAECNRNIRSLDKIYPTEKDPFHDPPPDMIIGTATIYLNPIAYICPIDTPISIIDLRGSNEGELLINIKPKVYKSDVEASPIDTDDENFEEEPRLEHFKGGRLKLTFEINGLRGLQSSKRKGVYAIFSYFNRHNARSTHVTKEEVENPTLVYSETFIDEITPELIDWCSNDVIEVTVFCTPPEGYVPDEGPREGFITEEVSPTMAMSPRVHDQSAGLDHYDQIGPPPSRVGQVVPSRSSLEDNDAFAERERLELKIRQLEAQLANSKKGSTCMLL